MRVWSLIAVAIVAAGCAGKQQYIRPIASVVPGQNVKEIAKSRDAVWAAAVPELGKRFFVINNLDKSSGLINLSYSGDPEKYIDCGRIISFVQNARGARTYDFSGSRAQQSYEVMNPSVGLFFVERSMSLDGRVNLIFEELGPNRTRVTANTRYVVQRKRIVHAAANSIPQTLSDSVQFNSGGSGTFPGSPNQAAECLATGQLEREILEAIQ